MSRMSERTNKRPNGLHKAALAALFTVGNTLICFPWRSGEGEMPLLFLLSALGALLPSVLIYPLLRRWLRAPLAGHRLRLVAVALLSLLLGGYALFAAVDCMRDYLAFARETVLPNGGWLLLCWLFVLCAVLLSEIGDRGLDGFALLGFFAVLLCAVGLFLFGLPDLRPEHLTLRLPASPRALLSPILALWWETLLPLVLLCAYLALVSPRGGEGVPIAGTAAGFGLLAVCVLQTLMTFGAQAAATYPYPYAWAVRTISIGPYFFRLEGFSYLPDYLACLTRCAVCLAVVRRLVRRFFPRRTHLIRPVLLVSLSILLPFLLL